MDEYKEYESGLLMQNSLGSLSPKLDKALSD